MPSADPSVLRLGTRGSLLARTQSRIVADDLERHHPGLRVELVLIKTTGDVVLDKPLHDIGGKGLFVKELELALLSGQVDFAVHSFKDVPVTMPLVDESELIIAATTQRQDARDALAWRPDKGPPPPSVAELPQGAVIATGSLRRRCQLLQRRPDLVIQPIRGNVDTRLRKLREGPLDGVILAMAGLRRIGLFDGQTMRALEPDELLPAPGQGALALQCRRDAEGVRSLLGALHDAECATCVEAEREIVRRLGGDCHSPIAAYATPEAGRLRLRAAAGARDGQTPVVFGDASGPVGAVVDQCFEQLKRQGADRLLRGG
jgi:hydroxymethylbilane synthase